MATCQRTMEGEEQEALFGSSSSSYPCAALYYVQSPSTASHANSNLSVDCGGRGHPSSPSDASAALLVLDTAATNRSSCNDVGDHEAASRLALSQLSRYSSSSSRGSNSSFKKPLGGPRLCVVDVGAGGEEYAGGGVDELLQLRARRRGRGIARFVAVDLSSPCACVLLQVGWRFLVSFAVALLVFFFLTKPPVPKVSFKVVGFKQFSLREGLDNTGVATKILSSNCSVAMEIDNNSKAFGLHVHSPTLDMGFGRLKLASSLGPDESYVESDSYSILGLYVAVKDRPVYGAGRSMQDMLESGQGLPLAIRMGSSSSYRVVGSLIRLRYRHQEECLLVLEYVGHDERSTIRVRNSTCAARTRRA
ncbi:uncharacterized protein M6B38_334555 [Iris pallida]|uniref:Uncharacterized protein n=1 Tax=Iris pallida TaxID=29817 RepID=A0AAX6H152_IRIPA|nr:uncharacterized protein M6B38_334555 [Iris pallida]